MNRIIRIFLIIGFTSLYGLELSSLPLDSTSSIKKKYMKEMMSIYRQKDFNRTKEHNRIVEEQKNYPTKIEISGFFIKNYLENNVTAMKQVSPIDLIDKLKSVDSKVREVFAGVIIANSAEYGDNVIIAFKVKGEEQNNSIKFQFIWMNKRWILMNVI